MRPALLLGLFTLSSAVSEAQNASTAGSNRASDIVVVTATRTERTLDDVPATVSIKTAEEIERVLARDIRDLVRYEPGVSVGGTGERFGLGGFTIRGIGGNRVLTTLDGIRVADAYSFGPFLSANRNYVDIDELKALEIVRGPGSALYGSDALGGVVAYRTKDAVDYLGDDALYTGIKTGYSGVDDGSVGSVTLAAGGNTVSGMLLYTHRKAHETENYGGAGGFGTARQLPDPLDSRSDNALLKLSVHSSDRHRLTVSFDSLESETESQVQSDYGLVVGTTRTDSHDADDTIERQRASLDYSFLGSDGRFDSVRAQLYSQTSEQVQRTRQRRVSLTNGTQTDRWRDSYFDQEVSGLGVQADKRVEGPRTAHYFVIGGDFWSTDSASLRAGGTINTVTGAPGPEASPLPTRDFPPTTVDQYGLFMQDEIALLAGRLLLTPSLRFDSFDAAAHADAIYFSGNPGQPQPADFADSAVSPRLGLLYRLGRGYSLYAQYSEGFKAPPYGDVNVGFTNPLSGYKTISNPNLESERSRNAELGLRMNGELGRLSLVAFRNRYDDFIESLLNAPQFAATGGIDPADGLLTFQSQNIAGVEISGVELSGDVELGATSRWSLRFALARAKGTDESDGTPLNSVDPLKAVLGVSYAAANSLWGSDIVWTVVDAKSADDIAGTRLATPGYGVLDLLGYRRFGEHVRLNVGLFNVTDKRYIEWADTASIAFSGVTGTYPEAARFTHPGFNAGATVRVEF